MPADLVPELTDGTFTLRAHRDADIPRIIEQVNDPRSARWTTVPLPYGEADARDFLEQIRSNWADGSNRWWAIDLDGQFAGTINYRVHPARHAELGYGLHPDARAAGLMTRAARLVLGYAFDHDGIEQMRWRAAVGNHASWRVAWANGFQQDGRWPEQHRAGDGSLDDLVFGHVTAAQAGTPQHAWWEPTTLEANGVRLRSWQEADRPAQAPEEQTTRYLLSRSMLPTPDTFDAWLVDQRASMSLGEGVYWCIADVDTDAPLGGILIDGLRSPATQGTGSLAYWLDPHGRGRGVLGTALELVIPHAFAERTDLSGSGGLGLHRLWAGTDERNRPSQRALRRAGMREVLTERQVLTRPGQEPSGAVSFELLATDDRDSQRLSPAPETVIETDRLRLRPWRENDRPAPGTGPDAAALRSMPPGAVPTQDTFDAYLARRGQLRDHGVIDFCIADRATDESLGSIAIFQIDDTVSHGEVGYWLHPPGRGKGYLDEALEAVVRHALTPVAEGGAGLNRLHAGTVLDNFSSRAVLLRHGFRRWGIDHQAYVAADGQRSDGAYYELLRDWLTEPVAVEVPVIDSELIRLRPPRMSDAQRVMEACSDRTSRHWLATLPDNYQLDDARRFIHQCRENAAAGTTLSWCVADPQTDQCLGWISVMGLRGYDPLAGEVGYWLHPEARGRGLMTEALQMVVRHASISVDDGGLGRRRLMLNVAQGNDASVSIARRAGFEQVGQDRLAEPLGDGSYVDLLRFDQVLTPPVV